MFMHIQFINDKLIWYCISLFDMTSFISHCCELYIRPMETLISARNMSVLLQPKTRLSFYTKYQIAMKGREENTDDRKRRGKQKRQAQIWTDLDKTNKSVCIAPAIVLKLILQAQSRQMCNYPNCYLLCVKVVVVLLTLTTLIFSGLLC